ncbi:MAG: ABC1 kinase family protein [Oligoflexus sp.]
MNAHHQNQQVKAAGERSSPLAQHFAIGREFLKIYKSIVLESSIATPLRLSKALLTDSGLDPLWSQRRLLELVGDVILNCFNSLGPVYGKAGQVALSRLSGDWKKTAEQLRLNRLYSDWPAMDFELVEQILDEEVPDWHQDFVIEPHPIGVASMAQVHVAVDDEGRKWVMKVMKPHAKKRLHETLDAIEQMIRLARPLELTAAGRRGVRELRDLVQALRLETDLKLEKTNIDRMRSKLNQKKQQVLHLPQTLDGYCTTNVLTVEMFDGISLADVVAGEVVIPKTLRKKLARRVLQELLIQVFEIGLFHGDPHAGNLILLADGTVGLFDWGLTGELVDSDRRHISALLKAVMAANMERLIDTLEEMALEHDVEVDRDEIEQEIRRMADHIKLGKEEGRKPSLQELLEMCLKSAESLQIPVPEGLLLMAKSLLTIEGLARGIDPEVAMGRIATPVLLRAAKPGLKDLMAFSKRLPKMASQILKRA